MTQSIPREFDRGIFRDCSIIFTALVVAYCNSLWGVYQLDDFSVIVSNNAVHSWAAWLHKTTNGGIRPVLNFSYMLNWTSGMGTVGFHLINNLIHFVTTLLVYVLSSFFVEACSCNNCEIKHKKLVPLFTALLFAVHPVQTEAVTYLSGRSSSLMTMLYLASVLAYLQGVKSGVLKWTYLVSPILFVTAVASKEVAISLPFVLLAWERVVQQSSWKLIFRRQVIHWLLFLTVFGLILTHPRYAQLLLYSFKIRSFHDTVIAQINGITYLMGQLVHIGSMNIDPDVSRFTTSSGVGFYASLCVWGAAVIIAVRQSKQQPWFLFAVLWFAVALFPSNSLVPRTDIINERHVYLASPGIFLCCVIVLLNLKLAELNAVLLGGIVCLLAGFTLYRNADYQSEIRLWEQTARLSPAKSRVFNNLGCAYEIAGQYGKAEATYTKAVNLQASNKIAADNLQRLNTRLQRMDTTIK